MKKMNSGLFLLGVVFLLLILVPFTVSAPDAWAKSTDSFDAWLERYGAWDLLEKEYARKETADQTPETILKRAEVYLNLNSPKQALEIIEMTPAFDAPDLESKRLWLGGQAHRALGEITQAVLWFSQSASMLESGKAVKALLGSEPGLEQLWMDVWLKTYWNYSLNPSIARESQRLALDHLITLGRSTWRNDFWKTAQSALKPDNAAANQPVKTEFQPVIISISDAEKQRISSALALVSLEKFDDAQGEVAGIANEHVRFFWQSVLTAIVTQHGPADITTLTQGNFLKAAAFWQGEMLAQSTASLDNWVLGNQDSGPWTRFRNNLLAMPADEAVAAIDKELGSMLISAETAGLLQQFKLALTMIEDGGTGGKNSWDAVDKHSLPYSLQLAGALRFNDDLSTVLPKLSASNRNVYSMFMTLVNAAGGKPSRLEAPFWIQVPPKQLPELAEELYPMDQLLLMADWQRIFAAKPTTAMAKRAAYLFDSTAFGTTALLYLADGAVKQKHLQLAAFYLNQASKTGLSASSKAMWLDIKTRIELDAGRSNTALLTFKELSDSGADIPVMTRLRMALLFQQKRDFESARQQLLAMWEKQGEMTTTLRAETLFWLGEGEQGLGNTQKALDYYLRLAWKYPQENIWALTAMYRASIIYEKRGKYDTAKRLLGTVVKHADTKEQKEAAKARIAAINKKMGKTNTATSTLVYPY